MKKSYYRSDFLFANSSFWIGMGSVLSVFSPYYTFNSSATEKEADRKAIESDFGTVGEDLRKALDTFLP